MGAWNAEMVLTWGLMDHACIAQWDALHAIHLHAHRAKKDSIWMESIASNVLEDANHANLGFAINVFPDFMQTMTYAVFVAITAFLA